MDVSPLQLKLALAVVLEALSWILLQPQNGVTGVTVMLGRWLTVRMKILVSTHEPDIPITVNSVVVVGLTTCCAAVESVKVYAGVADQLYCV